MKNQLKILIIVAPIKIAKNPIEVMFLTQKVFDSKCNYFFIFERFRKNKLKGLTMDLFNHCSLAKRFSND